MLIIDACDAANKGSEFQDKRTTRSPFKTAFLLVDPRVIRAGARAVSLTHQWFSLLDDTGSSKIKALKRSSSTPSTRYRYS